MFTIFTLIFLSHVWGSEAKKQTLFLPYNTTLQWSCASEQQTAGGPGCCSCALGGADPRMAVQYSAAWPNPPGNTWLRLPQSSSMRRTLYMYYRCLTSYQKSTVDVVGPTLWNPFRKERTKNFYYTILHLWLYQCLLSVKVRRPLAIISIIRGLWALTLSSFMCWPHFLCVALHLVGWNRTTE